MNEENEGKVVKDDMKVIEFYVRITDNPALISSEEILMPCTPVSKHNFII